MAQDGLTGFTFDFAKVPAIADAHLYKELSIQQDRLILGVDDELPVTSYGLELTIGRGEAIVMGRMIKITDPITLKVPSLFQGYLVAEVDLAQYNDHSGDIESEDYKFTLNQATIKIVSTITDSVTMHDAVIGVISATSTSINFTKDWNFYNSGVFLRSIDNIPSSTDKYGYGNNFMIGSTSNSNDDHSNSLMLPILANSNNPVNVDDTPSYNYDAVSDDGGFTGTLPTSTARFSRLEYRWLQTGSVNRIMERIFLSENDAQQGEYQRYHVGVNWGPWKKVATTADLATFSQWSSAKSTRFNIPTFSTSPITITEQSGIITLSWGGSIIGGLPDSDTILFNTSDAAPDYPLPRSLAKGFLINASDKTLPAVPVRWQTNGNVTANPAGAITAGSQYWELGLTTTSQDIYNPLKNANYSSNLY